MANSDYSRRTYLKYAATASVAGMAGIAGCTGSSGGNNSSSGGGANGSGGGGNGSSGNNSESGGSSGSGETMEVLHGWTGGDGQRAANSLIEAFNNQHGDINANFQAVGGGGNTNLDTTISNRAQNGNLPSSWADWPGLNLVQFTEAGLLGDISDSVWTDDLRNNYSEEAQTYSQVGEDAGSIGDGPYVAVPIGSHRMNDFFYNVSVVEEAGVDPTSFSQPSDIVGALEQVDQNTDAIGMAQAHAAPFTTLQLWSVVMQGQSGYQAYMDFINGDGDQQAVQSAFELIQEFSQYYNEDVASISFTEANQKFMNNNAAFVHNGNWVAGAYRNQEGFAFEEDWDRIQFPGTEDMYGMHLDSFPMPAEGPAAEAARTFLSFVGTTEAQVAFNQYKGSIPPRTDAPTDAFGPYLTQTIEDYNNVSNKPPTIAHGLGVLPGVHSDMDAVITNQFRGSGDAQAAAQGMMDAVSGSN